MKEEPKVLLDQLAECLFIKLQDRIPLALQLSGNIEHQRSHANPEAQHVRLSAPTSSEQDDYHCDQEGQLKRCHQLLQEFKVKLNKILDSVRLDVSSVVTDSVMKLDNIVHNTSQIGGQQSPNTIPYPALPSQLELPPVGVITIYHLSVL